MQSHFLLLNISLNIVESMGKSLWSCQTYCKRVQGEVSAARGAKLRKSLHFSCISAQLERERVHFSRSGCCINIVKSSSSGILSTPSLRTQPDYNKISAVLEFTVYHRRQERSPSIRIRNIKKFLVGKILKPFRKNLYF